MTTQTIATATLAKLTRRSRNIGFGWTNSPAREGFYCEDVKGPSFTGTVAEVEAEYLRIKRLHSGGIEYRVAFFVGGRRIKGGHFLPASMLLLDKMSDAEMVPLA